MNLLDLVPFIRRSSYLELPSHFYEVIEPTPIENPYLLLFNHELASYLAPQNCPPSNKKEMISFYAGNTVPKHLKSIALAYAGHQFGYYVPLLGDGRAVLIGEISSHDENRWDIQLKGSGKTMFSRMGDGRAPLSSVLREYLISEAMYGLNIPTTRSLAAVASKEMILRQDGPVPLGVLTRIASSSLRVGSFEYAAAQKDNFQLLQSLANYAIERHYPELIVSANPYLEFFKKVVERQARLIADWMGVGFIHGVMNTDNMTISGETIDYGPCAFMDEFDFGTVFSSIDRGGRYAFGNQATIAKWNLTQLSLTLLPLLNNKDALEQIQEVLNSFTGIFSQYWNQKIRKKIGILQETSPSTELIKNFFGLLQQYKPDYTNTFRLMSQAIDCERQQKELIKTLGNQSKSELWVSEWLTHIKNQNLDTHTIKTR